MESLKNIRKLRKGLNLTQHDLAEKTGVSQSLIAKIESGRTEPTYSNAMKILNYLQSARKEVTAEKIMTKKISTCRPDDVVKNVIKHMKKLAISQLPVMKDSLLVGIVTESSLLEHIIDENPETLKVNDVMESAPPTISPDTPEHAFLPLLKFYNMVAVVDEGRLVGVITKSDVIKMAYS